MRTQKSKDRISGLIMEMFPAANQHASKLRVLTMLHRRVEIVILQPIIVTLKSTGKCSRLSISIAFIPLSSDKGSSPHRCCPDACDNRRKKVPTRDLGLSILFSLFVVAWWIRFLSHTQAGLCFC